MVSGFSALRRLKTWCRGSMTDGQLALGYINQERTFSPDSVLQAWDRSGHRRIALAFHDRGDIDDCTDFFDYAVRIISNY